MKETGRSAFLPIRFMTTSADNSWFLFHSHWQRTKPMRFLLLYNLFQLAGGAGFMYYFCRYFGYSRRLVVLHSTVLIGVLLWLWLLTGLPLLICKPLRGRLLTRYGLALVYGIWTTAMAFLYLADFVSNRLWGSNINYQLVSHYILRRGTLDNDTLTLPPQVSLTLLICFISILSFHFWLSTRIMGELEELFLPARPTSLFHGRSRTLKSIVVLGGASVAFVSFLTLMPTHLNANWSTECEPVTSFLRSDLYDINHDVLAERLRLEEPLIRANYPRGQTFERKNVIVIIVDSLRADHMQIYGYRRPTTPFLNGLVKSGKLKQVELATSTCSESNCGILSTLASKNLRAIVPEVFKLHDLLHDQGYSTYFILSGDHEWYGLKKAYGNDLTYYFDGTNSKLYPDMLDDRLIFEGLEHVPDFSDRPAFFYFHLMSAHFSGFKQEQYRYYQPANVERDWKLLMQGKFDVVSLVNEYDNGVTQADAVLQELFAALQRKGYLANSVAVILADHGEGLGEHGAKEFGHVYGLYQEFIRIPLLFFDESNTTYTNLKYATQIDVAPTILARLGLAIPSSWQGQSLLGPDSGHYSFHQTRLTNPAYAILFRTEGAVYKYMYRARDRTEELYELNRDPGETTNLIPLAQKSLVQQLRTKLAEYLNQ